MDNVSVNPELLSQYGSQIVGLSTDYISEISSVYKILEDLNNCWHGDAADKFNSTVKGFEPELKKLGPIIEEMGNDLIEVAKMYSSFNDRMSDEISKL